MLATATGDAWFVVAVSTPMQHCTCDYEQLGVVDLPAAACFVMWGPAGPEGSMVQQEGEERT